MIKFFKNIRQRFISEGKTKKYLLYALGEIVLVVIGILIALQINNWNEQKNNDAKITSILKEIQSDLIADLKSANMIFEYQVLTDSISKSILNNRYTAADIRSKTFYRIGYNYRDFKTVTNGFDNLKGNINNIPKKYASLLPEVKDLYVTLKTDIDVSNDNIREMVLLNVNNVSDFDWYQDALKGIVNEEQVEFYLTDKKYKKLVSNYMSARINVFSLSNKYRVKAINLYYKIQEAIGSKDAIPDLVNYKSKESTLPSYYAGTYKLKETSNKDAWKETLDITLNDGQLRLQAKADGTHLNLLYFNKNIFFADNYYDLIVFDKPEKGQVYITVDVNFYAIYEKIKSNILLKK